MSVAGDAFVPEHVDVAVLPDRANPKVCQLLAAARRLFLCKAYDAVSTDAIAKEANVSKATLYAHFASKEQLFAAMINSECQLIENDVWQSGAEGKDIGEILRKIARNFMAMFATSEAMSLHRMVIAQVPRFPEIGTNFYESGPKILNARIAELLRSADNRGMLAVPDPELAAPQFLSLIICDVDFRHLMCLPPLLPEEIERLIESGVALFLRGYGVGRAQE